MFARIQEIHKDIVKENRDLVEHGDDSILELHVRLLVPMRRSVGREIDDLRMLDQGRGTKCRIGAGELNAMWNHLALLDRCR